MKKLFRAVLALCALSAIFLAGCRGCSVDMNSNDRSMTEYYALHADGDYYYYNLSLDGAPTGNRYIRVDKATGESSFFVNESGVDGYIPGDPYEEPEPDVWNREDGDITYQYSVPELPVILNCRDNNWRGYTHVSEENYGILETLTQKYETDGVEFIHILLLDGGDGSAYGFVNVYDHTTGLLFGAGVAGVSGISYGVFIKYTISTGETKELLRVDGGCITAFDKDTVLYFKDVKYYSHDIGGDPQFLFDDMAYDSDATQYSYLWTFFNERHFVVYMHSDKNNKQTDYVYIIGADGNLISSCQTQDL